MTDEQIRIHIAAEMGWTHDTLDLPEKKDFLWKRPNGKVSHACAFPDFPPDLPDYPNDLNACREFEETLCPSEMYTYYQTIRIIIARDMNAAGHVCHGLPCDDLTFIRATARQRCESFLMVKGIWLPE